MRSYEVIIAGGGPVGLALAIELGLNGIETLVLEKHEQPLKVPRAQSLSARSMEFFLRWGVDKALMDNLLLPVTLPQTGIWCTSLCGETFFETAWGDNRLDKDASSKVGVRVPLWVTEATLEKRLADFPSVHLLRSHELKNIMLDKDKIQVEAFHKTNKKTRHFESAFLACCDGAAGPSKKLLNNAFKPLSDQTKMLGLMFRSREIKDKMTVSDGIMYFVLAEEVMAFAGPIDLKEGLWHAQIIWNDPSRIADEATLSHLVDSLVGHPVKKDIESFYFWDMQVQLANFFQLDQRIFWLGDAAHAFAPTGGLGLNTGLGDAQNLGWKLAAVIKKEASDKLLASYVSERMPIWQANLDFARQNAEEFIILKKKHDPQKDFKAFAQAYASLGNRYLSSSGLTLGYGYLDSPLTRNLRADKKTVHDPFHYQPKTEPGYFLPHRNYGDSTIYEQLSPEYWTLILNESIKIPLDLSTMKERFNLGYLNILKVKQGSYPCDYLLVRPDWHIAEIGNDFELLASLTEETVYDF